MNNRKDGNINLVSYGNFVLPPVVPGSEVEDLCNQIDEFYGKHANSHKKIKASELIKGAFYAIRLECRSNPDWMSQSANSIRDLLYPLLSRQVGDKNLIKLFKDYAVDVVGDDQKNTEFVKTFSNLSLIYGKATDLAHHGSKLVTFSEEQFNEFSDLDFDILLSDFVMTLRRALGLQQIYIHNIIDIILKKGQRSEKLKGDLCFIFKVNIDSKNYFFTKANESWLVWLIDNGFLDEIKKKAEDSSSYSYKLPELNYLECMATLAPQQVVEFILSVPISETTFNPEVVNRFIWIANKLPAEQAALLVKKIRDDGWIWLMRKFNESAYEFDKMVKTLVEAKKFEELLILAQAILSVKTKEDFNEKNKGYSSDNFFCLNHINDIGFFEKIVNIDPSQAENSLKILSGILGQVIELNNKDKNGIFKYESFFHLYDADIFEVGFKRRSISSREDVENLVIAIKLLIEKVIIKNLTDAVVVNRILALINELPENSLVWRLKLFTLAQCPEIFKGEIKTALFRVFKPEVGERYFEITKGAEYGQVLVRCFNVLEEPVQREYVEKVFEYFGADLGDKDKEIWRKREGGEILCFIHNCLTLGEKTEAKRVFGVVPGEVECVPEPISSGIRSGSVNHRSPEDIGGLPMEQIIEKLKNDLSPKQLKEKYNDDDFLNPRGAEGLGDALKEDLKKRPAEYFENILRFFDRENIAPHYLYSILRGIEDMLRDKIKLEDGWAEKIINLFDSIKISGDTPFERGDREARSWLADWITVHKVMADIVLLILRNENNREKIQVDNRPKVIGLIDYLLSIKESPSKEDEKPEYGELFNVAINSVRGRAYEALVMFAQNDGEKLAKETKDLFIKTLADESLAVRFVIGHYLATFYFRDKEFVVGLLSQIFPQDDKTKKDIYLATWEGYLSNTLYDKLFVELNAYYKNAILFNPKEYPERKNSRGLDELLATHIALAFAHLGLEQNDELFQLFWTTSNIKRHQEFISFIGRSCLTNDQAGDERLKEKKVSKKKLIDFWDFVLVKDDVEPEVLAGFGYWINRDVEILPDNDVIERMVATLQKSNGDIDWDYNFMKRLPIFAEKNQEKTLEIISSYLLDNSGNNLNLNRRTPFLHDDEIKEALKIIYKNDAMKPRITNLINILIEKGSTAFWNLKEVVS